MKLIIQSPTKSRSVGISWLEIDTPLGNFIIQNGHTSTILPLLPDSKAIVMLLSGKQETISIPGGIANITKTTITLLLES